MENRNSKGKQVLKESEELLHVLSQIQDLKKSPAGSDKDKKIKELITSVRSYAEKIRDLLEKDANEDMQNLGSQFHQEFTKCEMKKWGELELSHFKVVTDVLIVYLRARAA